MIAEWFMSFTATFTTWLAGIMPEESVPEWFTGFSDQIVQLTSSVSGLGIWVPWTVLNLVVATVCAWWGIGFTIKLARAVIAHLPWVGGAG